MIPVNIIIFILIGTLILVLGWIFKKKDNYNLVPRKIWTYWDNSDNSGGVNKLPKAVKLCMESWKKFNPDYEIVLLTKKNFQGSNLTPDF
jgi:mannosyltransferase OCH1-like enzyme